MSLAEKVGFASGRSVWREREREYFLAVQDVEQNEDVQHVIFTSFYPLILPATDVWNQNSQSPEPCLTAKSFQDNLYSQLANFLCRHRTRRPYLHRRDEQGYSETGFAMGLVAGLLRI